MRYALTAAALAACFAAAPASATSGLTCRPVSGAGPSISVVIGHGAPPSLVGATLVEGGRTLSTMEESHGIAVGRSWIDDDRVWLDLFDTRTPAWSGQLRAQAAGRGRDRHYAGTFVWNGRLTRVRCEES